MGRRLGDVGDVRPVQQLGSAQARGMSLSRSNQKPGSRPWDGLHLDDAGDEERAWAARTDLLACPRTRACCTAHDRQPYNRHGSHTPTTPGVRLTTASRPAERLSAPRKRPVVRLTSGSRTTGRQSAGRRLLRVRLALVGRPAVRFRTPKRVCCTARDRRPCSSPVPHAEASLLYGSRPPAVPQAGNPQSRACWSTAREYGSRTGWGRPGGDRPAHRGCLTPCEAAPRAFRQVQDC
jgi:hypothetical protein